jgi:hypothetical protein
MFLAIRTPRRPFAPQSWSSSKDGDGEPHRAERAYGAGDVVFRFEELEWRAQRDLDTVQHLGGGHFFHPLLARTAHSCEPNCCISFPTQSVVAIRTIAAGEAITYDWETTETWFSHPFWCRCGSRRCRGRIG